MLPLCDTGGDGDGEADVEIGCESGRETFEIVLTYKNCAYTGTHKSGSRLTYRPKSNI